MSIERALEALRRKDSSIELGELVSEAIQELTKPCETCGGRGFVQPYFMRRSCPNNCVEGRVPL